MCTVIGAARQQLLQRRTSDIRLAVPALRMEWQKVGGGEEEGSM